MVGFGWFVLALVFLDELLAMVATGIWGWHVGDPTAVALVLVVLLVFSVAVNAAAQVPAIRDLADVPTMPPTR